MKIIAISDIHGYLMKPSDMPEGDVLCICGDIVPLEYQNSTHKSISWFCLEFIPWVDNLEYKKVIFIGGNHDFFLQNIAYSKNIGDYLKDAKEVLQTLLPGHNYSEHKKLIYLFDNSYNYNGVTFYGTPWINNLQNWAFYKTSEDLIKVYDNIPKKVDVLLTHQPPAIAYVGDVLQHGVYNSMTSYGSWELRDAILQRKIKYNICGHVHSGNHTPTEIDGTIFVNVSLKDENYKINYNPFVFEI